VDRAGNTWVVFDIDGTREAARCRALPQTDELPPPFRRLDDVCAPGYQGRKRGEVVRTRTTVSQAQSYQWLGSFGNRGNGRYREELRKALSAIGRYLTASQLPPERTLLRLDGHYGNGAVLSDVASFAFVTRGKDYHLLDHPLLQARLHLPPDQCQQRTAKPDGPQPLRYDCPQIPVGPEGVRCRVIVATHQASKKKSLIGVTRAGIVYELFFTTLPHQAFTACDVGELYLHRGAFEPILSDEDSEQDPDRWCSHSAWGQECWQLIAQWVWNLRLELGHQLEPTPPRITEFAPAIPEQNAQAATRPTAPTSASGYGPPTTATSWKTGRFTGQDFPPQPDGTLRCPAGSTLTLQERRQEADGSLRLVYAASIRSCRPCPLRNQCQCNGRETRKPRQVSVLLHPLAVGSAPVLWWDWSRRQHRRACLQLRNQRLEIQTDSAFPSRRDAFPPLLSRAQRARFRLSFPERLARNRRPSEAGRIPFKVFGIPAAFATFLGC
jgi:hypothetical protein